MPKRVYNKRHGAVRDMRRIALEDNFYKLTTVSPRFGSEVQFTLNVGMKGASVVCSPTLDNLCWHFGYYAKIDRRIEECMRKFIVFEQWEMVAFRQYWRNRFEYDYVIPMRREWKQTFWFYCLPKPEILEKDLITGEILGVKDKNIDEESEERNFDFVLSALPVNAASALQKFNLSDSRLKELGKQVCWLVSRLATYRAITTVREAKQLLESWLPYIPSSTYKLTGERIAKYLPA